MNTYVGAGSPSASHSMINGLSLSSALVFTRKSNSSVGGCLMIRGGLCTENIEARKLSKTPFCPIYSQETADVLGLLT